MGKRKTNAASLKDKISANRTPWQSDWACCPGMDIEEMIESMGMTKAEFARRMGVSVLTLHRLIRGDIPISPMYARQLSYATEASAEYWSDIENAYRLDLVRLYECQKDDLEWLKKQPLKLMKEKGFGAITNDVDGFRRALKFYGVGNVKGWRDFYAEPLMKAGFAGGLEKLASFTAQMRIGELKAEKSREASFTKRAVRQAMKALEPLVLGRPLEAGLKEAGRLLRGCGVTLHCFKDGKFANAGGACRWLDKSRALAVLPLAGRHAGEVWLSLACLVFHLIAGSKKGIFLEGGCCKDEEAFARAGRWLEKALPQKMPGAIPVSSPCRSEMVSGPRK